VGKATLALLVPNEDNSIASERLASAHPADGAYRWADAAAGVEEVGTF
jgi:hypothetical protein